MVNVESRMPNAALKPGEPRSHADRGDATRSRWASVGANRVTVGLWIIAVCLTVCGCTSPRFQEARAVRRDSIQRNLDLIRQHEATRIDNIQGLCDLHLELEEQRVERGRSLFQMIRTRHAERARLRRERMSAFTRLITEGNTDRIPDTFEKMFY